MTVNALIHGSIAAWREGESEKTKMEPIYLKLSALGKPLQRHI